MTPRPASTDELETPVALVDVDRMQRNLTRAAEYSRTHSLGWRPHTKTHKCPELGREQLRAGACGLTVATLREAEVMAGATDDLLLAYPPIGRLALERLMELPRSLRLSVAVDSAEALRGLDAAARRSGRTIGILLEIDAGMGRVGVGEPAEVVDLARAAEAAEGVELRGILFYPGHVRSHVRDQAASLTAVSDLVARFTEALRRAELPAAVVSGGSTPTFWRSHEISGLTEVRPGTNIFNDRTTALVGACAWEECAYTVLATVISTAVAGQAVIDAGAKALAKEELRAGGDGYAALLESPDVKVRTLSEEHGILDLSSTTWRPRVGDRVRVVPNHVCVSVNLQEHLYGVRGEEVVDVWEVAGRGRARRPA